MPRPVPWVPPVLYAAVLAGGVYYAAIGPGLQPRTAGYAGLLAVLLLLDARERRIAPWPLFAVRAALLCAVTALDVSGLSRVLFVLVPFLGFFAFGPAAGVALGAGGRVHRAGAALAGAGRVHLRPADVHPRRRPGRRHGRGGGPGAAGPRPVGGHARRGRGAVGRARAQPAGPRDPRQPRPPSHRPEHPVGEGRGVRGTRPRQFARAVAGARWSANRAPDEVRVSVRTLGSESEPVDPSRTLADLVHHLDGGTRRITLSVPGTQRRPLLVLYRAAQEGLTNACRHSGATDIRLSVAYDDRGARLRVVDNGRGFAAAEGFGLTGLRGLRERVRLAEGTLEITSSPVGTVVEVRVPW